jgi:hypothetical protein
MTNFKTLSESQTVEFKSAFSKEVIISLSAFANASSWAAGETDTGKLMNLDKMLNR